MPRTAARAHSHYSPRASNRPHHAIASNIAATRATPARQAMPTHRRPRSPAPASIPSYRRFRSPTRTTICAHPSANPLAPSHPASPPANNRPRAHLHYSLPASIRTPITPSHPASRQPAPHPRVKPCPHIAARVHSPPHPYPRIAAFVHPPALQPARIHPHSHRAIASSIAATRSTPARHAMPTHRRPRTTAPAPIPTYRRFRSPAPASIPSYRRFRSPARAHRQKIAARENLLTRRCHTRGVRRALRAALSRCGE